MYGRPFNGPYLDISSLLFERRADGRYIVTVRLKSGISYPYLVKIGCNHKDVFDYLNKGHKRVVMGYGYDDEEELKEEVQTILKWCELGA